MNAHENTGVTPEPPTPLLTSPLEDAALTTRTNNATQTEAAPMGLRERKKGERRRRILSAASQLFAERGYDSVTTSEIALAADVGVGTLFRYAGSKAELLVSVMNERVSEGITHGLTLARQGKDLEQSILAILHPLAQESSIPRTCLPTNARLSSALPHTAKLQAFESQRWRERSWRSFVFTMPAPAATQ